MKTSTLIAAALLATIGSAWCAEGTDVAVKSAPIEVGEVNLGRPTVTTPAAPAPTPAGEDAGLPRIGGPVPVFTTMAAASAAGVNPMAEPASSPAQQPAVATGPLTVTDDSLLGRISALPLLFKLGALLLAGVAGFAVWEWKRR